MQAAVRLALIVGLLAAQLPVCKVALARSLSHIPSAQPAPAKPCKKGCCAVARPSAPAPSPEHKAPTAPQCPTDCLSPLCSPIPVLNEPAAAVVQDAGTSGRVLVAPAVAPNDHHPSPLDRPPRA